MLSRVLSRLAPPAADAPAAPYPDPLTATALERLRADDSYEAAAPFPHMMMDDLFEPVALRRVLREWPHAEDKSLERFDNTYVRGKRGTSHETQVGPYTQFVLDRLCRPDFLLALEKLTGITGLIPDPYFFGGGLHFTSCGGKLAIHADFNMHPRLKLDRRLNLLVYLNEGWTEQNQGWLELWDREMTACVRRVLPIFNRMAIFSTTDYSFHGQPEPIVGPPTLVRRSIALYYYTNGRPAEETRRGKDIDTIWRKRPNAGY
jgi:hypothetical protein